jgi:hypothetical protein
MWNEHGGGDMIRADEVTIEEYRKAPAKYGFSYPTWAGVYFFSVLLLFMYLRTDQSLQARRCTMFRTYRSQ